MRLLTVSAIALAAVTGGVVLAHEGRHHDFFRKHVNARIESALDAASVTAQQRATIEKAKDRVFATIEASHQNRKAHIEKVMQLFEADHIDAAEVKALREQHDATARADGDAVISALTEAHDVLQPQQRKAVADHVRANKPEGPPPAVAEWFKKRALSHVNDALDQVKASPEQRKAVEAALDQVWSTMREEHQAGGQHLDEALKLFEADRIDPAQVAKLRGEQESRRQKISDAVTQAFHDVHDALTSTQRKQLVAWVRANHPHM